MQDFKNKRILIGITGGIAAYKSAYLIREFIKLGALVQVVMTEAAEAFITPMTLQALSGRPVRRALFDEAAEAAMGHIELARWADYIVIAPATANTIAKCANGLADDLLSTIVLASTGPLFISPAMNQAMWHHPATQANLNLLKARGAVIVGPGEGIQACGDEGFGRMLDSETIVNALRTHTVYQMLQGRRVVITAGPTREMIDPVRYLSNRSSGKMGYALAHAALIAGAEVVLISGPSELTPPEGITFKSVITADEMYDAVMDAHKPGDIFIGAAAVSDYKPDSVSAHKIKKQNNENLSVAYKQNKDILKAVGVLGKASFVMGFAAETTNLKAHALEKLHKKKVDCIVANLVGEAEGFDVDTNEALIITKDKSLHLSKTHKVRLAGELVAFIATTLQNGKHVFSEEQSLHEAISTT